MNIGERITQALELAGKSQADLARHLGTKQSTINGWCRLGRIPAANVIPIISDFCGVSNNFLLIGIENTNEKENNEMKKQQEFNEAIKKGLDMFFEYEKHTYKNLLPYQFEDTYKVSKERYDAIKDGDSLPTYKEFKSMTGKKYTNGLIYAPVREALNELHKLETAELAEFSSIPPKKEKKASTKADGENVNTEIEELKKKVSSLEDSLSDANAKIDILAKIIGANVQPFNQDKEVQ